MFNMCTALANTPKLCATVLADNCYTSMFFNTAITNAPELPATILAEYCYGEMFCYCTNLISAPKLPATTLADSCYSYMFEDCSKITELHYPSSIENNSTFTSMDGSPQFGATNAIIYYDL